MIFLLITDFFRGKVYVGGELNTLTRLADLMAEYNIPLSDFGKSDKGYGFFIYYAYFARTREICIRYGITADFEVHGFPKLRKLYMRRIGLLIGAIIGTALILLSERFIWSIDVVGNNEITYEQITDYLKAYGIAVGKSKKAAETHLARINAEIEFDNLAWISVNFKGTKAVVELRETTPKQIGKELDTPLNLVAKCDGQVIYAEARSGEIVVKRYEVVTKGQLLIGGLTDSKTKGFKKVRAVGKVLAYTEHIYETTVEKSEKRKSYTGKKQSVISFSVFGKTFSLGKDFCDYDLYDTTLKKSGLTLFSEISVPVEITEKICSEYTEYTEIISADEAIFKARQVLGEEISDELSENEIISKEEKITENENAVTLKITVRALEDICAEQIIS